MADGGVCKTEGLNSFMSDFDFSFDFYCELCKDDGKNVEAAGFCVDCGEYLCGDCYNAHPKTRQTKLHRLLDKDKMPKDMPLSADRINKGITTSCKIHADRLVEFYCKTHNVLGCSLCFVNGHKSCYNIESIVEKSENILDSQEYKDFIQTMKSLDQKSRDVLGKARDNMTQTKKCYSDVIRSVRLFREKVIRDLINLEKDIIAEAQTLMSEQEKKMASISNIYSEVTNTLESMLAEFESLQSSRRVCQVYISMKQSSDLVKALQSRIHEAGKAPTIKPFKFGPNKELKNFIHSSNALGVVFIMPVHIVDIAVKSVRQKRETHISGTAVLTNDRLIIADHNNCRVKLLDTQYNKVISELNVFRAPWDVTAISRNQVAVTVPDKQTILLLGVSDTLTLDREITVDGQCRGVSFSKNRLVVTYISPGKLEIMDLSGKVNKRVQYDSDGNELFNFPEYVCVSNNSENIYVSDLFSNKVTSLTFVGIVNSVYSDRELKLRGKVCVDNHDNVYVCGGVSKNVHMLTADLSKIRIILTSADGLDSCVRCVSHCKETNKLYVGMDSDYIKVYQLP